MMPHVKFVTQADREKCANQEGMPPYLRAAYLDGRLDDAVAMQRVVEERLKTEFLLAELQILAGIAQNNLCAADQHHDWGPYRRSVIKADDPHEFDFVEGPMVDRAFRTKSERICLNCGKKEVI